MRKLLRFTLEIILDVLRGIAYFLKQNLRNFAAILNLLLPFIMYFIGQWCVSFRGGIAVGGEIAIPIVVCVIVYYLKSLANKYGKGSYIPVPEKRFTEVDEESGEVNVRNDRVQELILYLANLEDWLERKGLL